MALIKVPKTPRKAFNKERPPSALLLNQIAHLEWAVLPASHRKAHQLPKKKVRTEAQAAERVGQLTKMLLAARAVTPAGEPTGTKAAAPVKLPPLPSVRVKEAAPKVAARTAKYTRSAARGRGRR